MHIDPTMGRLVLANNNTGQRIKQGLMAGSDGRLYQRSDRIEVRKVQQKYSVAHYEIEATPLNTARITYENEPRTNSASSFEREFRRGAAWLVSQPPELC
jgi:hypothetical protein